MSHYNYGLFERSCRMESTSRKTASRDYINYRFDRSLDRDRYWVFTDGSTRGYYSAVVVDPAGQRVLFASAYKEMTATRNVGAEMNGLLLGLEKCPPGVDVTIVSDYLGVGAWMTGWQNANNDEVLDKIARAEALMMSKFRRVDPGEDESAYHSVRFMHHGSHQRDDSPMTMWNCVADSLCCEQPTFVVDKWLPLSEVEVEKVHLSTADRQSRALAAAALVKEGQALKAQLKAGHVPDGESPQEAASRARQWCGAKASHFKVVANPRQGQNYMLLSRKEPVDLVRWFYMHPTTVRSRPYEASGIPLRDVILRHMGPKTKTAQAITSSL